MDKFTTLQGIAAPLPIVNIDTDMIIPKQFLKTIKRTGLGVSLFYEMRYDTEGKLIEDFVLNTKPYDQSKILVAGDNFGCGSSREHAPWSLKDFGIRCVISTSFADIFYNNCFKNGILPITLSNNEIDELFKVSSNQKLEIEVDLPNQRINFLNDKFFVLFGDVITNFEIDFGFREFKNSEADFLIVSRYTDHQEDSDLVEFDNKNDLLFE